MKKVFYIAIFIFLFLSLATFKLTQAAACTGGSGNCSVKCTASGCILSDWKRVSNTECERDMCLTCSNGPSGCCGSWTQSKSCPIPTATRAPTPTTVVSPTATKTPTPTSNPSVTITPTPGTCSKKAQGDANCDGIINLQDFEAWRAEFVGGSTTKTADFNKDTKVNLLDYEVWRSHYILTM